MCGFNVVPLPVRFDQPQQVERKGGTTEVAVRRGLAYSTVPSMMAILRISYGIICSSGKLSYVRSCILARSFGRASSTN